MRIRMLTLVAALVAAAVPAGAGAQFGQYHADFPKVREQVLRKEARQAAYTLMIAAAHVREEVGRAREGEVGERLLAAESRLDQLVARLRGGDAPPLDALDAAFAATDRLLAEHHVRLASWGWSTVRATSGHQIGHDLGRAAFHFTRAVRYEDRTLDAATQQVVAEAERVAGLISSAAGELPKETGTAIAALQRVIVPPQVIAQQARQ